MFERIITTNRVAIQGENENLSTPTPETRFGPNPRGRNISRMAAAMNNLGSDMRQLPFSTLTKLAQGVSIDTGGLFRNSGPISVQWRSIRTMLYSSD
jgi:hypothetical protein